MSAWLTATATLLLGIFSFWLWQNLDQEEVAARLPDPHEPDYYIENMIRTTTGIEGELKNILRAELVEHFPDDDSTELASPHLEIYNGQVEPWHVIAERGWVSSGNDVVLLHGAVEIWRLDKAGQRVYQVITSELRVLPKEQYAESDNPTTIIGPSTVTHAIGMRANFAHDRLELLKQVRTRHEVKPQS
ncbi:MAG: LPS export ABC transporter periplasmic protein LptC [Gammaproteobacteria bacterium]|nr:LPS export ABC transporter periplasmic protein LptC [Gammaproteobacteria bacterium]